MPNLRSAVTLLILIPMLIFSAPIQAQKSYKKPLSTDIPATHYWFNGDHKQALWQAADEIVVHTAAEKTDSNDTLSQIVNKGIDDTQVLHRNASWVHLKLNSNPVIRGQHPLLKKLLNDSDPLISSVYYASSQRRTGLHIATAEMLVHFHNKLNFKQAQQWGLSQHLTLLRPLNLDHAYLFQCHKQISCLQQANQAYHDKRVKYAYPNWIRPKTQRHSGLFNVNDALFEQQWHLDNHGQTNGSIGADLNLLPAWTLGHGSTDEIIAIVDNGIEITHEDLRDNIIAELSWDFIDNDNDPTPAAQQTHGTRVAGMAAARGGNSLGVTGVAPHAGLVGLRFLDGGESFTNQAAVLTRSYDSIDIYSNSWGPTDDVHLEGPDPLTEAGLLDGVTQGRNGKGAIYVWAAGNGQARKDNANYDGYANSPYTIAVAASTHTGKHAPYSEKGANIWVNVPSSNGVTNITTTDLEGAASTPGNYTHNFGGTSAATPQVAGVAALMLEQNPQLGWRDVQRILAETAVQNDPGDNDWTLNGAGYPVSHKYGFGRVDAEQAVISASQWTPVPPQSTTQASIRPQAVIPDNDSLGTQSTLTLNENLKIEYVEVTFTSDHTYWGDLDIILISPSGTESLLAESNLLGTGAAYQNGWRFGVARLLGEHSQGQWTLTVKDNSPFDTGLIKSWAIKVYGTAEPPPIEFGIVSIDHHWKTIQLKSSYADPVVIVSPLTFNGHHPAVMRLQAVTSNQFQLRVQEWRYLDQVHKTETVAYLVVEKGRHQMADGSIWEAGTWSQSGTGQWLPLKLDPSSLLFLTVQSFNGQQTVTPRARDPLLANLNNNFATALFEEEALMDGHKPERIGYLAITATPGGQPQAVINGTLTPYSLTSASFTDAWTPADQDWQLKLEEEASADPETRHKTETISLLSLNARLFAQDMSSQGGNTIGLRIRPAAQ